MPLGDKAPSLSTPTSPKGKRSTSREKWNDDDDSRERQGAENGRNSRPSSRVKKDFTNEDILDIKVVSTYVHIVVFYEILDILSLMRVQR